MRVATAFAVSREAIDELKPESDQQGEPQRQIGEDRTRVDERKIFREFAGDIADTTKKQEPEDNAPYLAWRLFFQLFVRKDPVEM